MPTLVVITGIDGAGKSTLARRLLVHLTARRIPAACLYGRPRPLLSRLLIRLGRLAYRRRSNLCAQYPACSASKKQIMRNPLLSSLYTLAVFIDFYIQIWIKLLAHTPRKDLLILDRYLHDTVINDLAVHLSCTTHQVHRLIRRGQRLLPRPACILLLDLPEHVAYNRKNDIPHIDYLTERRPLYLSLLEFPNVWLLDGCQPPDPLLHHAFEIISQTTGLPPQKAP